MKHLLIALTFSMLASTAHAVSDADINRLFANPPAAGANLNQLLAAEVPQAPVAFAPSPAALTTTNMAPPAARPAPVADLENMFEVSYKDAETAISTALTEKGVADKVGALMDGRKNAALFVHSQPLRVETRGLKIDHDHHRWSGSVLFVAEDGAVISAIPASGHFSEMVEVPVLKRPVRNGDIIAESDIELRDFAKDRTRPDTISDLSSLIGKTPSRSISPYRPLRESEVTHLAIIKRDAMVQMTYTTPGMHISTTGQALAAGAKGDVIDVRNTASKKVVRAVIQTAESVQVLSQNQQT
ncbi:MAG: flagellar basal body P-ring formation chaperone FlgA, partial [Rickettsiales bacterium]|nr:flagellar basal body P-ring formation chaperone FlgA [Rickettsiales bacterium]